MSGNYLQLYQPKVVELFEILKKEKSSCPREFFNALESQDALNSIPWALNRISDSSALYRAVWNYFDNFRGARFEIQNHLNGIPKDLDLRLLATREIPGDYSLQGKVLLPDTLKELYELAESKKLKFFLEEGKSNWEYPLRGVIEKIDGPKCILRFE